IGPTVPHARCAGRGRRCSWLRGSALLRRRDGPLLPEQVDQQLQLGGHVQAGAVPGMGLLGPVRPGAHPLDLEAVGGCDEGAGDIGRRRILVDRPGLLAGLQTAGEHTDGVVQVAVQPPVGRMVRLDPVGDHRQVQAHRRRRAGVPFGDGSKGRHQSPGVRPGGGGQGVELVPAREDGGEQRGLGAEVVQQPGFGDLCRVGDGTQRGARIPVLGEQVEGLGQDPLVLVFPTRRWASGTAGSSVPGRRDSRGVLALLRIAGLPCTVSLPRIVAPRTVKLPRIAAPCTVSLLRIVAPRCGGGVLCHGKHSTDYLLTGRLIMATVVGLQDTEVLFLGDEADVDTRALDVARRPSLTPNREGDPVPAPLTEANVPAVLAELTLEQKASLCSGQDFWHTQAIDGAGVPAVMVTDGPHGLRKQAGSADHLGLNSSVPATCLPSAAGLASTWNRELIRRAGEALGVETRGNGVAVLLGPGVNMKRTPLCGRNFEYFSEDPYLAGELATEL